MLVVIWQGRLDICACKITDKEIVFKSFTKFACLRVIDLGEGTYFRIT